MIIFDLDGTLADCEHRRHFVDPNKAFHEQWWERKEYKDIEITKEKPLEWKPDWKAFYEACDKDDVIRPVMETFSRYWIGEKRCHVEIWSGRCESVREKTLNWFFDNWFLGLFEHEKESLNKILKMRPIGNNTLDDRLKEKWLDEAISEGKTIDFVFDDRPRLIRMWKRRGIFVFNCCQHDNEF